MFDIWIIGVEQILVVMSNNHGEQLLKWERYFILLKKYLRKGFADLWLKYLANQVDPPPQ